MTAGLRRLLVVAAMATAALALLALPAAADNCGTPSDCFTTARAAVAAAVGVGVLGAILSIGLDLSPLGTAKGIYEAFTGRDAITGEELTTFERFIGAVPGAGALLGTGAAAVRLTNRLDDAADLTRQIDALPETARASRLVPGGGLAAHERAGGHTLLKHVNQPPASLRARLDASPTLDAASTYRDRATAEAATARALESNQAAVDSWLESNKKTFRIDQPIGEPVGLTLPAEAAEPLPADWVRVILRRDPTSPLGYHIRTSFPQLPPVGS